MHCWEVTLCGGEGESERQKQRVFQGQLCECEGETVLDTVVFRALGPHVVIRPLSVYDLNYTPITLTSNSV